MTIKQTLYTLLAATLLPCNVVRLQNIDAQRACSSAEYLAKQLTDDAHFSRRREAIERQTADFAARTYPSVSSRSAAVTIPVVVHVVYNTASQNISDAQIQTQLDVLNRDFRLQNVENQTIPSLFHSVAADCNIEFCLAHRKPDGTSTNGIERTPTAKNVFASNDDMKHPERGGAAVWDATRYLNIWVVALGGGSLGYASYPGAPLSTDGVVIDFRAFGTINTRPPFHLGRTATHEIGHWLNLFHIWGDAPCGDDHCADTPTHHGANYGCPTVPFYNSSCGANHAEMTMNFMDYTNDNCMALFTEGQKTRMQALFAVGGARRGIAESNACSPLIPLATCAMPTNLAVSDVASASAYVQWSAVVGVQNYIVEWKKTLDSVWLTAPSTTYNWFIFNNLQPSTRYDVRVRTVCQNAAMSVPTDVSHFQTLKKINIIAPPTDDCSDLFEPNNARLTAKQIPTNATTNAQIGDARDRDWFSIKTPVGSTVKLRLSNLPADYDLKLFDANTQLVASSENMGTADENISFQTVRGQDSLFIMVYGYNGAFSQKTCYALTVNVLQPSNIFILEKNALRKGASSPLRGHLRGDDTEGYASLKIFPNPTADGQIFLEMHPTADGLATIDVWNLTGQIVKTEKVAVSKPQNLVELNVADLPQGVFIVRVFDGEQAAVGKFLKN